MFIHMRVSIIRVVQEQKRICEAEISKDFPSRNTIFDCACKLQTLKAYDGAIDYFLALSHKGYRTQEAYLHIAECYFMKKDYISSTSYIRDCLDMDETYEPAREFNSRLKEVVKQGAHTVYDRLLLLL